MRDTGTGIDKDDLPKLFSQFGRLHRNAEMNHDGIGLGLTIVKQIIAKCGGEVTVRSKGPGHGSVFIFSMRMVKVSDADETQLLRGVANPRAELTNPF